MVKKVELGHVVRDFYLENTHVRICDDYCRDKTMEDVKEAMRRLGRILPRHELKSVQEELARQKMEE